MDTKKFKIEKHIGRYEIYGDINDNGCWICKSHKPKKRQKTGKSDYYQILMVIEGKKKAFLMHRYIYELYKGKIEDDLVIRHTCDNSLCINPDHLIKGTMKDNTQDMVDRNRNIACKGENNKNSKLKNTERLEIIDLYKNKIYSQTELGKIYSVSQRNIGHIVNKK